MTLSEIRDQWIKDSEIDITQLDYASLIISKLHQKYWDLLISERLLLKKKELDHKNLIRAKFEYYRGKLSDEEMKELGWKPIQLRVVKDELPVYIDGDRDVISSLLNVAAQDEKVEYLKDILKMIHSRGYQIKNAIDFLRFQAGD